MLFGRTETSELTVPVNPPCFQWRYNRPSDTSSHYSTADPRHSEPRDSVMTPGRPCKRLKKWAQMISELEIIFSECDKWGKWRSRNEDLRTMAAAAFTENSNSAILNERNWNLVILFFSSKKRNYRVFTIISHMQEYIMKSRSIEKNPNRVCVIKKNVRDNLRSFRLWVDCCFKAWTRKYHEEMANNEELDKLLCLLRWRCNRYEVSGA